MVLKTSIKKMVLWFMVLLGMVITYHKISNKEVVYSATFVENPENEKGDIWKYT